MSLEKRANDASKDPTGVVTAARKTERESVQQGKPILCPLIATTKQQLVREDRKPAGMGDRWVRTTDEAW